MTRLDDAANLKAWDELRRKVANAPHGTKRQRLQAARTFVTRLLRQETRGRGKA